MSMFIFLSGNDFTFVHTASNFYDLTVVHTIPDINTY